MIRRSIPLSFALLLLFFTYTLGNYEAYPNNLPNRWDFPASFRYTAFMKEETSITELTINLMVTLADTNTPVTFVENKEIAYWSCGVEIANDMSIQVVPSMTSTQNTEIFTIQLRDPFPFPVPVSQLAIQCEDLSLHYPLELETPSTTAAVLTVLIRDEEAETIYTNRVDLTISDLPSMDHRYRWDGDSYMNVDSSEIHVSFHLYLPKTFSSPTPYLYLDHPLLDVNRIDSMHVPPTASKLDDLKRVYHLLDNQQLMDGFVCKFRRRDDICATIHVVRSEKTGKLIARATLNNPTSSSLCLCSFQVLYPPDVLHSILGQPQSSQVHMMIDEPDLQEYLTLATIPIDHPRMIPVHYAPLKQPFIWLSALHTRKGVSEFELGIATSNHDAIYTMQDNSIKRFTLILGSDAYENGKETELAEWSPTMACRAHDTLEYPEDFILNGGIIEISPEDFSGFGKTCRIRLSKRPTQLSTSWWVYPKLIPPLESKPLRITVFNPMHHIGPFGNPQASIVLYDTAHTNDHHTMSPFPHSQSVALSENLNDIQPIPFTQYTQQHGSITKYYANATIDINYLLPSNQPFFHPGMMLVIIFANRNTIDDGIFPIPTSPSFSIDFKEAHEGPTHVHVEIYQHNFHGVLDQHYHDPLDSVFQNGRPFRAPAIGLYPSEIPMEFKSGKTHEVTITFEISEKFDVENEPIYVALLSSLDLKMGQFTTQYAQITPATDKPQRKPSIPIGIVIASLVGVAAVVGIVLSIIWCRRNSLACFHQTRDEKYSGHNSVMYQELS